VCAALCVAASALAAPLSAQDAETTTTRVFLVERLGLTKATDMDFGLVSENGGGTVVMIPSVTPECQVTGTVIHSGACQPAAFAGSGTVNQRVRIRVPPGGLLTLANGTGQTMRVTDLALDAHPNLNLVKDNVRTWRFRIADPSGIFFFRVGGTLNVGAGQAPGLYSAEFEVDIQYF
jgi:hypothetical protein